MHTFRVLDEQIGLVPAGIARTLGAIDLARGREEAFREQHPEALKTLTEIARIQSTEASNAIERITAPHQRIRALVETLIELRAYIEASIDFVDEEIDFLTTGKVAERVLSVLEQITAVQQSAQQGRLLRDGMTVVIAGRPNAGKSSLLNRLAGYAAAIVTEIPGTTRDVLREHIHIDGMPVHIIDTAGLHDSDDIVEQEGMRRTWEAIATADRVLLIVDDCVGVSAEDIAITAKLPAQLPVTVVHNKIDLTGRPGGVTTNEEICTLNLSAPTGAGRLAAHLRTR